jgi:hypothetical protein
MMTINITFYHNSIIMIKINLEGPKNEGCSYSLSQKSGSI